MNLGARKTHNANASRRAKAITPLVALDLFFRSMIGRAVTLNDQEAAACLDEYVGAKRANWGLCDNRDAGEAVVIEPTKYCPYECPLNRTFGYSVRLGVYGVGAATAAPPAME